MARIVSKSEFARLCGRSPAAISNAVKRGTLKECLYGTKIDAEHEEAIKYLSSRPNTPTKINKKSTNPSGRAAAKEKKKREKPVDPNEITEIPEDIEAFADMTIREVIERFGTESRFVDFLSAIQKIEIINEKRLKNAEKEGTLVARDVVHLGIIEPINTAHEKMLSDGAKTIARRTTAMHDSGKPLEEITAKVVDLIASYIRPVKAKVKKALENVEKN